MSPKKMASTFKIVFHVNTKYFDQRLSTLKKLYFRVNQKIPVFKKKAKCFKNH